jgi:beta-glucanase (GH16 family)
LLVSIVLGCSSRSPTWSGSDAEAGADGKLSTGGSSGHGGSSSTSDAASVSDTAGVGDTPGGSTGSGGTTGAGGTVSTGGTTGGTTAAGGKIGAGGTTGTGGTNSAGGVGGVGGTGGAADADTRTDGSSVLPGWVLTWSDEFDGADGSAVDPTKWVHDVGGTGWGNQELEYYTDGTQNAVVTGGNLVITATTAGASSYKCSYPSSGACQYTSARLLTQNRFTQQYGRIEARIQIPEGQGLWPAFWMLGADIATNGWPNCGEIDIMENIGKEPSINHGSLHMPAAGTSNDDDLTGSYALPGNAKLGDDFHTYAVEWSAAAIKFYVDGNLYETQKPSAATGRTWEFDHPFFILLNVAVGGQWPGAPDLTTSFPQTMKVDWVRVYEPADGG